MLYFKDGERVVFCGEEKEGPSKGALTLFVSGETSVISIHSAIHSLLEGLTVKQIYLGAGFLSRVTPAYVKVIASYVETQLPEEVELTVEASYISFATLSNTPRITRWIYTTQMLNVPNPNYRQTMAVLSNPELRRALKLTDEALDKILIKVDFDKTCMVMRAQDVAFTNYETPYEDRVLLYETQVGEDQEIKPLEAVDPPYPIKLSLNTSTPKFEFRVNEDFPTAEVSVSPSPKFIFRSEAPQ